MLGRNGSAEGWEHHEGQKKEARLLVMFKHQSLEALIKLRNSLKPEETIRLSDVSSTNTDKDDGIKKNTESQLI